MILEKPRAEFLNLLKSCKHGLATKDIIPALACFCFYKGEVITYDDIVAVVAPCKLDDFSGGFRGDLLLQWLGTVNAKTVKLYQLNEGGSYEWRAGKSRLKVELLPPEDFAFTVPRHEPDRVKIPHFKEFLRVVAVSMGTDPSQPWRLGVTLTFTTEGIKMYSCDNLQVTEVSAKYKIPESLVGVEVILVPRLVEILLSEKEDPSHLTVIVKQTIRFDFAGDRKVFCRLSTDVDCRKFRKVLSLVKWEDQDWFDIPAKLERVLDETQVVLKGVDDPLCNLEVVDDGVMHVTAKGRNAEMATSTVLQSEEYDHPEIQVNLNPAILRRVIEYVDDISIAHNLIALRGESVRSVVSIFTD